MVASWLDLMRAARPDLELGDAPALAGALDAAVGAWPELALDRAGFARFVADRLVGRDHGGLVLADLYLACGCVEGAPAAIAAFDAACGPVIERAVSAAGATPTERADLQQVVRARLLVAPATESGEAGVPRIAGYAGRGALASWVRVVATREAQRLFARDRRELPAHDDEIDGMLAPDDDPELSYLKRVYRAEFKRALAAAIEALEPRDRLMLQQHALDGLSIDRLAALHQVHRATAARWLEAARHAVLDGTRRQLIAQLALGRDELASVMRLIGSRLDVSLPRLLQADAGPTADR